MRENFELFQKAKSAELEHEISDEAHWIRCENQNPPLLYRNGKPVRMKGGEVERVKNWKLKENEAPPTHNNRSCAV